MAKITPMKRKPKGYWQDRKNILLEAKAFLKLHPKDDFVKNRMDELGYSMIAAAIGRHWDWNEIRAELGLSSNKNRPAGYWDDLKNVLRECHEYIEENGADQFSIKQISQNGRDDLRGAISKSGGIIKIREKLNLSQTVRQSGCWDNIQDVLNECKDIVDEHGIKAINSRQLEQLGYSGLSSAISRKHGGFFKVREKLGQGVLERRPPGFWDSISNTLEACREYIKKYG